MGISTPPYTSVIDLDALAQSGKEDALAGRPSEGSHHLPKSYQSEVTKLRQAYHKLTSEYQSRLNELEESNNRLLTQVEPVRLEATANDIIARLESDLQHSSHRRSARSHKAQFDKREDSLKRFKSANNLIHPPTRGIEKSKLPFALPEATVLVILLYLLEAIVNGIMFINDAGLFPGLSISLAASSVNVLLGFLVGRFAVTSLFYHPNATVKGLAGTGVFSFLAIIIWLNFAIAVFRSQLTASVSGEVSSVGALWPFAHLDEIDITGALLLGVGIVFAVAALMDGWFSDDPFPGYGQKYRACLKERDLKDQHLDAYINLFQSLGQRAGADMDALFVNAEAAIQAWSSNTNRIQRDFTDYSVHAAQFVQDQKDAWEAYISSHERHRIATDKFSSILEKGPEPLLSQEQCDPHHVFSDVVDSYMEDEERLSRVAELKSKRDALYSAARTKLAEKVEELEAGVKKLEQETRCDI